MPVNLEWHPSLPVLQITYSGVLTTDEYQAMRKQIKKLLDSGPEQVIVLANVQAFEGFPAAGNLQRRREPILYHPNVRYMLVVLGPRLAHRLSRAITPELDPRFRVYLFADPADALRAAEQITR